MDHISALLPKVLQKRGLKGQADASIVVHKANIWFDHHEAPQGTEATMLRDGILSIEVDTSTAAQECHMMTGELLDELCKQFPNMRINKVCIKRKTEKAHQAI